MRYAILIVACAATSGCATGVSISHFEESDDVLHFSRIRNTDTWQTYESLFPDNAELLSDPIVVQTLDHEFEPPPRSRVAVIQLGEESFYTWLGRYRLVSNQLQERLIDNLTEIPQIDDASFLPAILIPDQKSLPRLRDAAATHQADLLLAYRSGCLSSHRLRFIFPIFGAKRSEGSCEVEAVLLDVRTGLVSKTFVVSKSFSVERSPDYSFFLLASLWTQFTANDDTLTEMTAEIGQFLSGKRQAPAPQTDASPATSSP